MPSIRSWPGRPWSRWSRSWLRGAGLAAAIVVAAGCAGVPTTGSVHVGRAISNNDAGVSNSVQIIPPGPLAGLTPSEVVNGFLFALVDSDDNYGIARRFLAPGVSWNSTSGTTVYSRIVLTRVHGGKVTASVDRIAVIDSHGHYRIDPATLTIHFTLAEQPNREWRIAGLPDGVLLSSGDVHRSLQPAAVYFLNLAGTRVVPDPLLVPRDQPGLATTLIQQLLAGPSPDLAAGVQSAAPPGTVLVGTVPIDGNGVAEISLAGAVQKISSSSIERLAAQIDWTMQQVPTVRAVRLLANGAPLTAAGVPATVPIDSWPQFDPQAPPTSRGLLLSHRGHVVAVGTGVPQTLAHETVRSPVLSADGEEVAAITGSGDATRLLAGATKGPLHSIALTAPLSPPSFGPLDDLFVISGTGPQARLVEVSTTLQPHQVKVPDAVTELGLDSVSVSRDGSRIALVVGPPGRGELLIGGLGVSHGVASIDHLWVAVPATESVREATWAGANEVVTTVERGDRREAYDTTVDGYRSHVVSEAGLPGSVTQVTAAPDDPLVATVGASAYALAGRRWSHLANGIDPAYAG
jgi:Lipoprotein LpqB beta-propeller domain/Sporulation and spore germination